MSNQNDDFTIYPAIDLRGGLVVRLTQGDPARQTTYDRDPAAVARRWLKAGARWLHVVNLDGAFDEIDGANHLALQAILAAAAGTKVQFGGGLRSLAAVEQMLAQGVSRVILGTVAVEQPGIVAQALERFGPERIGVGIDARDGLVRVRGWQEASAVDPVTLGRRLVEQGLRTAVFTNIARDGVGHGVDVAATRRLAEESGLDVIASGGVASAADITAVRAAGLSGVIVGRALYEGTVDLSAVV